MAEAECEGCRLAGLRECDLCGEPVLGRGPLGIDLCENCRTVHQAEPIHPIAEPKP